MSCVRGCCPTQRDHYLSVAVRPAVTPQARSESQLGRDLDAYKRMRKRGLQPKAIDGAAVAEARAESKFEVETFTQIRNSRLKADVDERMKDPSVTTPATVPLGAA